MILATIYAGASGRLPRTGPQKILRGAPPTSPGHIKSTRLNGLLSRPNTDGRGGTGILKADELAGIHDVGGVEGVFDPAHQLDLDRRLVVGDLVAFHDADAVLGADRP